MFGASASNGGNGAAAPGGNPIMQAYESWASTKPFVTRSTCLTLLCFWLLGLFVDLQSSLSNNLRYSVYKFEIYRVVTSVLAPSGILNLIFGIMAMSQLGPMLEYSSGSARFLALMATLDVCANLAFLAVAFLLSVLGQPNAEFMSASGSWNMLMGLMAVQCMQAPDQPRKVFFFPCEIPAKFYPLALYALLSLMSGLRVDMALGLGMGYAFSLGKLAFAQPSNARVQGWESGCLRRFAARDGYIVGASGQEAWLPVNPGVAQQHQQQQQQQRSSGGNAVEEGAAGGAQSSEWVSRNSGAITAPSVASKKPQPNAFAGSGQALGSSSSSGGGSSFMALGRTAESDPAAARAARLAALEARGSGASGTAVGGNSRAPGSGGRSNAAGNNSSGGRSSGSSGSQRAGNAETSSLLASSDHEVMMLQDMGYSNAQAQDALRQTGGDINAAVALLSSS